jgi:hypothetical protein
MVEQTAKEARAYGAGIGLFTLVGTVVVGFGGLL